MATGSIEAMTRQIADLRTQLAAVEVQAQSLRRQLIEAEEAILYAKQREDDSRDDDATTQQWVGDASLMIGDNSQPRWLLKSEEYRRYGRQMIMHEVGLQGQLRIRHARVLIVGMGGLGCPAAAYLAGAGVGTLGLVDGDTVEASNLHRQIAHSTQRVGVSKVESAKAFLTSLNPLVNYDCHPSALSAETALAIVEQYDLVLDCTDHPTSRYLISDACVLAGKPLVSASALRTDGQLIVLNNPPRPPTDTTGGPCYRCIFPRPPPADSVLSCGEGGILGPVVGVMGVLQALEALKLLLAPPAAPTPPPNPALTADSPPSLPPKASMLMFSATSQPPFRHVRMRGRHAGCAACGAAPTVTRERLTSGSLNYVAFCGGAGAAPTAGGAHGARLEASFQITARDFAWVLRSPSSSAVHDGVEGTGNGGPGDAVVVDVRDATQFGICALRDSRNVPWTGDADDWVQRARAAGIRPGSPGQECCYVVCRFGNDSQLAVRALLAQQQRIEEGDKETKVKDVRGGFRAWREDVDPTWPEY